MGRIVKKSNKSRNLTGHAIHRIRMAAKPRITQEDMTGRLARYGIEINQSQFAKIERGDRHILDFELAAIAKALRVKVQAFFE